MQAIILAGGKGTRLMPYTATFPKPLVPLGERPILEIVIRQLKKAGFGDIIISTGHLAGLIEAYFGDGGKFGVKIRYVREEKPLNTAGALGIMEGAGVRLDEDFLVMNGDILTTLDYGKLMRFHRDQKAGFIGNHDFIHKTDIRADDGNAGGHGFDRSDGKCFLLGIGGQAVNVDRCKNVPELALESHKMDLPFDMQL